MPQSLREMVLQANLLLPASGLVKLTWGNASAIDRELGVVAIKPSGVPYEGMSAEDLVIVSLDGTVVEGPRRPSSDTPTHLALYRAFPEIGGVVHTHSTYATAFAQARRTIPLLGTTHADLAPVAIPLTRDLTDEEIAGAYEDNTGAVLVETIARVGVEALPAALVPGHGVFTWGRHALEAVERAMTLEEVAKMAIYTSLLESDPQLLADAVRDKHHSRKHGPAAYYGQRD